MASNFSFSYPGGYGWLVGSYVPINYGSCLNYIELELMHEAKTLGRAVTLAYWICDKDFDINNLNMNYNDTAHGPRYCTSIDTMKAVTLGVIHKVDGVETTIRYVDTNDITGGKSEICRFNFSQDNTGIKASKIFIALISSDKNTLFYDYEKSILKVRIGSGSCYIKDNIATNNFDTSSVRVDNNGGLYIVDSLFTDIDGNNENLENSTNLKPAKIVCSDLRYRTWSDPLGNFTITTNDFNFHYTVAFADGGHNFSDVNEEKFKELNYTYNNVKGTLKTHISNTSVKKNGKYLESNFESDFNIPEGRLNDVVYAAPHLEAYDANEEYGASEGRWVFKRSRIKFTIPPATKDGKVVNKAIILRYKIITSIFDKSAYQSNYKFKEFTLDASKKNISLVICPRDEGVLDNMEFTVLLSRKYVGASDNQYSVEAAYKFRTYQKPTVNIAYPKIIRNSLTGDDFKYAKLLTSNMYSNFTGEKAIVNKYVCDALNVILATSQNDASDIPMFVRFFIAEYKYGRDGRVKNGVLDENFDTIQALYKSQDSSKYTTKNEILTGKFSDANEFYHDNNYAGTYKQTAYKTGIYSNDGHSILLSGRFTESTLKNVGREFKLWTYKDWDYVSKNTATNKKFDELVGNAWEKSIVSRDDTGKILYDGNGNAITEIATQPIIGDHVGASTVSSDGKSVSQDVSKAILFRAGYIYLLRVRMFHGAAVGAIARNYSNNKKQQILYGDEESGYYDYTNALYSRDMEYPNTSVITHGDLNPYNGWNGANDGTSGEPLFNSKSNKLVFNSRIEQTYSGFSEVDYSLFEPVCPYTSKSNLITVHPTSSQISANQWITFNYRHLAKNIGGIDVTSAKYDSDKYVISNNVFGKSANGIQNTLTRIAAMYTSAIETLLNKYAAITRNEDGTGAVEKFNNILNKPHTCEKSTPTLNYEKISIWIKPVSERTMNNESSPLQNFIGAYLKDKQNNYPIVFDFPANGRAISEFCGKNNSKDKWLYYSMSLCHWFAFYRVDNAVNNLSTFNAGAAPEHEIIYKYYNKLQTGTATNRLALKEPLGNTYRWQPVINAMTYNSSSVNMTEIQIENVNNDSAKSYTIGDNTLNQTNNSVKLIYANDPTDSDYNLQTGYFYTDEHTISAGEVSFTNNTTNRFCIKEFAGETCGDKFTSGYPVMYTTASNPNKIYGSQRNVKYFCTALQINKNYGHIYSRVPTIQDCECGIPIGTNNSNVGNVSSKGSITINNNENNPIPFVRTTHYLYFKTWINTTFVMKVDVSINVNHTCEDVETTNPDGSVTSAHNHTSETITKTLWFNGSSLVEDIGVQNANDRYLLDVYPNSEIKFGNSNGLSEVYGEDNHGWGRCLSADDISNRQIKTDGTINPTKTQSGGLEVPIMVRYTPLLQPKLLAKVCTDSTTNKTKYLSLNSSNITLTKCKGKKQWTSSFVDNVISDNGEFKQIETGQIDLKIAYPYIDEKNTYNTVSPNGGNDGNVYFEDYFIDVDTDVSKSIDLRAATDESTNMDFLGGTGVCTAYTAILVPSNPDLSSLSETDKTWFFNNTDKHWNFYKQPANYYKSGDIFKDVRSKDVPNCGPVLIGYNLQPTYKNTCDYISNSKPPIPSDFVDDSYIDSDFIGRNYQTISLNFTALRQGKFTFEENNGKLYDYSKANSMLGFKLTDANVLQPGVIYDLVIIPVYSNTTIKQLTYNSNKNASNGPGLINGQVPGGNVSENDVHLAGSNPLVLYNYFQIGLETEKSCGGGGYHPNEPDIDEPDPQYIADSDSAIAFPNVDNVLFNTQTGNKKESPGFWLNNSFKLILRMPSFRTKTKTFHSSDLNTIENMSNGMLNSKNGDTANDFEFSDIQIHIGKIEELEKYGYPDDLHLNLNKITDKNELAKAHIISYSHYGSVNDGVFSKKLSDYSDSSNDEDPREKVTGGSLDPSDPTYAHRFIEVNLSNCKIADADGNLVPIYTDYPEGYYIQFRWKSKYADSQPEEQRWSDWYGGSYDGGLRWWGANGVNYFVPIRNYSDIYTDFRNRIKESYPGSATLPKNSDISDDTKKIIESMINGKGSIIDYGLINDKSTTNPKDSSPGAYYHVGVGNHAESPIVPTNENINVNETLNQKLYGNIILSKNNDNIYYNDIQYILSHDKNHKPSTNESFSKHQNLWEMLYVDYVIRNMCKLYYKPNHNEKNKDCRLNEYLYYHLSVPYIEEKPIVLNYKTWGWDDTEYRMFNQSELIQVYKRNENEFSEEKEFSENKSYDKNMIYDENDARTKRILGPNTLNHNSVEQVEREKWNRNKYYRRVITRQDFDELNKHLEELVKFIRHSLFTGLNDNNLFELSDLLPVSDKELSAWFNKTRRAIIGHDLTAISGLSNVNNINHTMIDSNYIQKIWQNILSVCKPSIFNLTNTTFNLK